MNILHLSPGDALASGITDYSARFRASLRATDVTVEHLDITVTARRFNSRSDVVAYAAAADVAWRKGFDIVHAEFGGGSMREFYAARRLAKLGAPVVATLHDPPGLIWWPFNVSVVRRRLPLRGIVTTLTSRKARTLELDTLRMLARPVVLSHTGARALDARWGEPIGAEVIPFSAPLFDPSLSRSQDTTSIVVGFHGFRYGGTGLGDLLDAVAALASDGIRIEIHILGCRGGSGPRGRPAESLDDALAKRGIASTAEVLGYVGIDKLGQELRRCDVIVLPRSQSRRTPGIASVSAAIWDAQAAGIPVIATRVRASAEQIEHGVDGLIVPEKDQEALRLAIKRFALDPQLRSALRGGAEIKAMRIDRSAPGLAALAVYRDVLGRERSTSPHDPPDI